MPAMPSQTSRASEAFKMSRLRIATSVLLFTGLTVAVYAYQFHRLPAGSVGPKWEQLQWKYLWLVLLFLPTETVCASLRMWLLCNVLHPGVRFSTCVKAELSNMTVALLTPSQTGGGVAQIYMLARAGVSVGTSVTISLISFTGTMVVMVIIGLYSLLTTEGPLPNPLFVMSSWFVIFTIAALIWGGLYPDFSRVILAKFSRLVWRLRGQRGSLVDWWPPGSDQTVPAVDRLSAATAQMVDLLYGYRADVRQFLRSGKTTFAGICLLSLLFLLVRMVMPYFCLRFLGLETAKLHETVESQMMLTLLLLFAPTPGSAGLAEEASVTMMSGMVPAGFVTYYNLLWRSSTAYVAALAGLFCLASAVIQDTKRSLSSTGFAAQSAGEKRKRLATSRFYLRRNP